MGAIIRAGAIFGGNTVFGIQIQTILYFQSSIKKGVLQLEVILYM